MPVQKSRKTPSKRGMHRSHDGLAKPAHVEGPAVRRNAHAPSHHRRRFLPWQARDREAQRRRRGGLIPADVVSARGVDHSSTTPSGCRHDDNPGHRRDERRHWRRGLRARRVARAGITPRAAICCWSAARATIEQHWLPTRAPLPCADVTASSKRRKSSPWMTSPAMPSGIASTPRCASRLTW